MKRIVASVLLPVGLLLGAGADAADQPRPGIIKKHETTPRVRGFHDRCSAA